MQLSLKTPTALRKAPSKQGQPCSSNSRALRHSHASCEVGCGESQGVSHPKHCCNGRSEVDQNQVYSSDSIIPWPTRSHPITPPKRLIFPRENISGLRNIEFRQMRAFDLGREPSPCLGRKQILRNIYRQIIDISTSDGFGGGSVLT